MNLLEDLQEKGYRITRQRKNLFKQIGQNPQTAEEIFRSMEKKSQKIDLASVYRGLQFFVRERIIREVDFGDGKKRYELFEKNKHHHHFICENCGVVKDVVMKENEVTNFIKDNFDYKIRRHTLEFFGLCQKCN